MKKFLVTLTFALTTYFSFSQCPLEVGKNQLNAGVGLSSWGIPIYVGFDHGVYQDITIGGEASFRNYHDNFFGKQYNHSVIGISGNGNYHFNRILAIPVTWDLYAGCNLGFYIWNSTSDYPGSHTSGIGFGIQLGGRYYFSEKMGLNFEVGSGNGFSGGKFGISVKL